MKIETIKPSDVSELARFASFMFTDTFGHLYSDDNLRYHIDTTCSEAYFTDEMEMGNNRIDIIKQGDDIIAYAKYGLLALPVDDPVVPNVEIHRLYVDPKLKRGGIGRQLMAYIEVYADEQKASAVYLGVYSDNVAAQGFYERLGYGKVGEYDYYVGEHIDHEFIFMKRL